MNMWQAIEEEVERRALESAKAQGLTLDEYKAKVADENRASEQRQSEQADAQRREREQKLAKEMAYRADFGASLGLPVPAHVGHIIKLGGLSANSMGNGITRGTAYHVVLGDALHMGRLKRKKGDLLCRVATTIGRSRSMSVSGTGVFRDDELEDWWHNQHITCAACKAILYRIKDKKEPLDSLEEEDQQNAE